MKYSRTKSRKFLLVLSLSSTAVALLPAKTVLAAELEEVVVTAQKQSQSLQDVPVSVSAVSGAKLASAGIQRAEDLSAMIPNFSVQQDPIGDKINIRGIQSGNNAGLEQSVSTFVDGVYRGRGVQGRFAFLDVERVEVLRGPQGTLFGKNTIGGAVNIISAKPTDSFEGAVTGIYTFENMKQYETNGYVAGPLSDNLRGRVAFQYRDDQEGYIDNDYYGESTPQVEELAFRTSLAWDFSDATLVSMKLEYGDFDLQGQNFSTIEAGPIAAFGLAEKTYTSSNIGDVDPVLNIGSSGVYDGDSVEVSFTIDHQMDSGNVTAIGAYSAYEFQRDCDCDFSPLDLIRFDDNEDFEQYTFEVNYQSENDGAFNYITGAYFLYNELLAEGDLYFNVRGDAVIGDIAIDTVLNAGCAAVGGPAAAPGDRNCILSGLVSAFDGTPLEYVDFNRYHVLDQEDTVAAVYFKGTWELSDTVIASLGVRYTSEEKTATQSAIATDYGTRNPNAIVGNSQLYADNGAANLEPFLTLAEAAIHSNELERTENSFTWSANLQWHASDMTMLYASASTGFKAGGYNSFAFSADPGEAEYEEEEVLSFEIGSKLSLLDGSAELNIAIFHSSFDDIQTALFTGSTAFIVQNASQAVSEGIELDGRWSPTENLLITGGIAYVNFEFDEFPNAGCYAEQLLDYRDATSNPLATLQDCSAAEINDLSGRTSENTPELSASLSFEYSMPLGQSFELLTNLDLIYQDEQYRQADLDPVSLDDAFFKANLAATLISIESGWEVSLLVKNLTDEESFSYVNDTPLVDGARQFIPDRPRTVAVSGTWRF
jgi:iron complex outermembrane recepter protein